MIEIVNEKFTLPTRCFCFIGTRSAPREIVLDNSILPTDPSHVRVSTPPRVITLSEHHFPSASDEPRSGIDERKRDFDIQSPSSDDHRLIVARPRNVFGNDFLNQRLVFFLS